MRHLSQAGRGFANHSLDTIIVGNNDSDENPSDLDPQGTGVALIGAISRTVGKHADCGQQRAACYVARPQIVRKS